MSFVQCQEEIALAQRVLGAKASATKEMTRLANQMRQQGQSVITLSQGEPDFATPEHVRQAAKEAIDRNESRYTEVAGTLALREAVVRKFERDNGLHFSPDQIQVGCGAKQALYNALQATVQDGDEVIIPTPAWVSYPEMVLLAGGQPVIVRCSAQAGFKLQADQLERAITPRTKWLMLNSPSNPSGAVYSRQELEALEQVLLRHPHVWVMADDVYEKIRYSDEPFATPAALSPYMAARTLTINGVSKAYAMTGWRVGFAAGPLPLIKAMNLVQSQATSHTSSISQAAAVAALDGPMDFLPEFVEAFRRRRDKVIAALNAMPGIECDLPMGAFYVFPSCQGVLGLRDPSGQLISTDKDLCMYFLRSAGVAVVPGSAFELPGHFRVSYASSDQELEEAMSRIAQAIARLS
ncbi:pyridoxal phosphate-dependent aminotransferase [Alcaligenes faecalis subsp. faecalis]|uniref:pyridoxal phosphate-dependent aminotransferase n=1 Tax=Alcaligenes faecalis TaxID=511 RepID=UPI001F404F02|nr:pyridoxal phosphate-dependent aminotransferase [Alcaligenes faecalis]MBW4789800.1 pyridoxal phosphate-dependent aminotransferase [Alcaligenes faecalis subsp. faecalis]